MLLMLGCTALQAQKYMTKTGYIKFYSHSPIEDIEAENEEVAAILNGETGALTFALLIKSFEFEKALMQEHFNENYLESDEYPKAIFKGQIKDFSSKLVKEEGEHKVNVTGELTLHGETNTINASATLTVSKDGVLGATQFIVKPEDYRIRIPNAVRNNIAKEIEVTVRVDLQER